MTKLIEGGAEYRGATFRNTDLEGVVVDDTNMRDAVLHEADLAGAKIEGRIDRMTVNGFRVDQLIDAELLRLFPERAKLRAKTPAEFRDALEYVHRLRAETLARAANLPSEAVEAETHSGDWSIVEQLRHLLFAEGQWANWRAFGESRPFHRLSLPPSFAAHMLGEFGITAADSCSFEEVREALEENAPGIRAHFDDLTADALSVKAIGVGDEDISIARALSVYLNHEWEHHHSMGQILDGREHD